MSIVDKINAERAVTETNIVPELKGKIADAAELRNQLLEAQLSYGQNGQLNLEFPRRRNGEGKGSIPAESNGDLVKRTKHAADLLVDLLELDPKDVFASKGRIVLKQPKRDLPFILGRLEIPVKWEDFSKIFGADAPRPSRAAALVSFVDEKGESVPRPSVEREGMGHVDVELQKDLREGFSIKETRLSLPRTSFVEKFMEEQERKRRQALKSPQL